MDRRNFLQLSAQAGVAAAIGLRASRGFAQKRKDVVRVLAEGAPNSLDPHGEGVSRESLGAFTNVYDRLIAFDRKAISPGVYQYDYAKFKGELAQSYEVVDGGRALIFHLRPDASFHDGAPVTAEDVRWSLERGVTLAASKRQLATGSLTDAQQFKVIDPHTLRIDLPRADRYALPNLALTFASVLNSKLALQHATPSDPWASAWLRGNAAGGGAFKVSDWQAAQQVTYERFDNWKSGPLPQVRRALFQQVPTAANRVAALNRGDADIVVQLPPRDIDALRHEPQLHVLSIPVTNTFRFIAFNTQSAPFNDVRVRQAIAYALPYTALFQGANDGHGTPLYDAASAKPSSAAFPQPYPYSTQLAKARALLGAAGLPQGFKTTFSYNVADATVAEPLALLLQESLAKIGIQVTIEKIAGAQWGTRQTDKTLPFYVDSSSAWFNEPDYFFRIFFQGDWRWNFGNFRDEQFGKLVEAARWEPDRRKYDDDIRSAIGVAFEQLPILPLWLPSYDIALQSDLTDFTYYIHGQVDFRPLRRV